MQKISGMVIFTGTCWAFSSARWRRLTRISADCTRSTWAIGDAERVGLHHGADEGAQVGDVGALAQRPQCVCAALADLHLPQDPGELLGQRALGVAGHLLDGRVEAEAGLDADGEQVDGVGEVALQSLGALVRPSGRGRGSGAKKPDDERADDHDDDPDRGDARASAGTPGRRPGRPRRRSPCRRAPGRRSSPRGLPARSSLRRIRSAVSAPESRRPSPQRAPLQRLEHPVARTTCRAPWSSSFGALVIASRTASERVTPLSVARAERRADQDDRQEDEARCRERRGWPSHTSTLTSRLIQNTPIAKDGRRACEHRPAQRLLEHDDDVVVVRQQKVDHEERRKAAQHPRGELSFCGQRGDLATDVLALAHRGGHRVEQLGEVAADLALDLDGHDDPLEVLAVEPLGDALEGVLEGDARAGSRPAPGGTRRRSARRPRGRWCRPTGPGRGPRRASRTSAAACRAGPR